MKPSETLFYDFLFCAYNNNIWSFFTTVSTCIKCLCWQGEITKGYRKLARKWHPDMASKAEVGWFFIFSLVFYTLNAESKQGEWLRPMLSTCRYMINIDALFCQFVCTYKYQRYFKMIWKNSEVLWIKCKFFIDYFVNLMRFLIYVHVIAGEWGVYEDVSENSQCIWGMLRRTVHCT